MRKELKPDWKRPVDDAQLRAKVAALVLPPSLSEQSRRRSVQAAEAEFKRWQLLQPIVMPRPLWVPLRQDILRRIDQGDDDPHIKNGRIAIQFYEVLRDQEVRAQLRACGECEDFFFDASRRGHGSYCRKAACRRRRDARRQQRYRKDRRRQRDRTVGSTQRRRPRLGLHPSSSSDPKGLES